MLPVTARCTKLVLVRALALGALGCAGGGELVGAVDTRSEATAGGGGTGGSAGASGAAGSAGTGGAGGAALGTFTKVARLDALSLSFAEDQDPTLPDGELEIFFQSDRDGTDDLWTSRRQYIDDEWPAPTKLGINTSFRELDPAVSSDGLTLWFVSDRAGGPWLLWVTSRQDVDSAWSEPTLVTELDDGTNFRAPAVDTNGLSMVFAREQGPQGGADLFIVQRPGLDRPWQLPAAALAEINSPENDWDPFLGGDSLVLYWATDKREIEWAARASPQVAFEVQSTVAELGAPAFDPTLSRDLRHIVFASDRTGDADLYEAWR